MTVLSARQVAGYWVGAGGPRDRAVEWVAISYGESSWDTSAVSSAGAIGLWQIMPFNAPPYGYTTGQLYDPAVNASIAVQMSGSGQNCAAWDSCYADIEADGRLSFLSWPQQGSADYNNLSVAAAALGGAPVTSLAAPAYPGISDSLESSVAAYQALSGRGYPAIGRRITGLDRAARRLFAH